MSSQKSEIHIVKYSTYVVILLLLLAMTFLSVLITQIDLGPLALAGAIGFATIKSSLVLWYFMHLKFERRTLKLMMVLVIAIYVSVLVSTVLDFVLM
jgi:cytochrome c oxidase subunit IV